MGEHFPLETVPLGTFYSLDKAFGIYSIVNMGAYNDFRWGSDMVRFMYQAILVMLLRMEWMRDLRQRDHYNSTAAGKLRYGQALD